MQKIDSLDSLSQRYDGEVGERSLWKEIDHIDPLYRRFIEASPFLILSTYGSKGVDCSPRGDPAGFVRVVSPRCIQIPDRKGNNRTDSLRNIIENSQVGLIFLVPGAGETLRVSGRAEILANPELCESFAVNGRAASSVLSIAVDKAYYQCQKAIVRSKLWDQQAQSSATTLPSAGELARHFSQAHGSDLDAEAYDAAYAEQLNDRIY